MNKIGVNKPCPCGSGKKYKKCHKDIKAEVGVLRKAYNIGEKEDFYSRFIFGHGNIRTCVYGKEKQLEYDESFNAVFQNLLEMKMVKDKCLSIISNHLIELQTGTDGKFHGHQIDINNPIDDELNIFFKDFFIRGQMAIDALIKHSLYMKSNIGFLFCEDEKKFRNGLKNFILKPDDERFKALNAFVENHKIAWYSSFKELRNKIEHKGWSLPILKYSLNDNLHTEVHLPTFSDQPIEKMLNNYWESITLFCEEVVTFLLSLKLKDNMVIVYVPENKRSKELPVRYIISHKDFPGVPLQCG